MDGIPETVEDIKAPRVVDGAFDPGELAEWLAKTEGGYGYRMIGEDLKHLGVRHDMRQLGIPHGALLITDSEAELRYGGAAARIATDFNYETVTLVAAGEIFRDEKGEPAMRVGGKAWSLRPEAYSFVKTVIGWIPERDGMFPVEDARVLPQDGETVAWPEPEAPPESWLQEQREWAAAQPPGTLVLPY